ncbi:MAG: SPOR domain-containing protein [Chitinispirillales bacterium]|nr:SPOR domain-containing protein [Chitinispirillales bacterium]
MKRFLPVFAMLSLVVVSGCTPPATVQAAPGSEVSAATSGSAGAGAPPAAAGQPAAVPRAAGAADGTGGPRTFLDTLNRGKEVALTAGDLPQIVITPAVPASITPQPAASVSPAPASAPATVQTAAIAQPHFRIQILATSHADAARREKARAETAIGLPIVMVSEQPLYKLFAGEFGTRAEAETALPRVRSAGYSDAWIVSR